MTEVNGNTWPARVEVETVEIKPPEPIYGQPWVSEERRRAELIVVEPVESKPFIQISEVVETFPAACASNGQLNVLYPASFVHWETLAEEN